MELFQSVFGAATLSSSYELGYWFSSGLVKSLRMNERERFRTKIIFNPRSL